MKLEPMKPAPPVTRMVMLLSPPSEQFALGDALEVCPLLPRECLDLIIADPPYNLRKSFNGRVFTKKSAEEYAEYTRKWLSEALRLLRDGGTLYLCCDWETSIIVAPVLSELLTAAA